MTKQEIQLFFEKAYTLENSSFWKWLNTPRTQSNFDLILEGDWLAHENLSKEALDSFCLHLRLLIQDRDGFSIRAVKHEAQSWEKPNHDLRDSILHSINSLHQNLDSYSLVSLSTDGNSTYREVFDIIFYGGLVHSDMRKRNEYKRIVESGLFSFFVFQSFTQSIFFYRNCITEVAHQLALLDKRQQNNC